MIGVFSTHASRTFFLLTDSSLGSLFCLLSHNKVTLVFVLSQIFGPVQQILKFKTLDEVIERANDSDYGLAAAVFSRNINSVNKIVQSLRAGTVW